MQTFAWQEVVKQAIMTQFSMLGEEMFNTSVNYNDRSNSEMASFFYQEPDIIVPFCLTVASLAVLWGLYAICHRNCRRNEGVSTNEALEMQNVSHARPRRRRRRNRFFEESPIQANADAALEGETVDREALGERLNFPANPSDSSYAALPLPAPPEMGR